MPSPCLCELQVFLKSDRVAKMVQTGGLSALDCREVFKRHIEKRVRSLPEIDGLSKETVLSSWMAKFDAIYRGDEDPRKAQQRMTASAASELILSKDQLYEMFQQILGIKKFEHQLLYQACQVGGNFHGEELFDSVDAAFWLYKHFWLNRYLYVQTRDCISLVLP